MRKQYSTLEEAQAEVERHNASLVDKKKAEKAGRLAELSTTFLLNLTQRDSERIHAVILDEMLKVPPGSKLPSRTSIVKLLIEEALDARDRARNNK